MDDEAVKKRVVGVAGAYRERTVVREGTKGTEWEELEWRGPPDGVHVQPCKRKRQEMYISTSRMDDTVVQKDVQNEVKREGKKVEAVREKKDGNQEGFQDRRVETDRG